jgi:hypothetical protein
MKQTILSLLLFFAVISQSEAQKKNNLKVYAYAYDNSGKYVKMEIYNPNSEKTNVFVFDVWFGNSSCFHSEEGEHISYNEGFSPTCGNNLNHTPPAIPYKGIALILYTVNGKKRYYIVKNIKVIAPPKRDYNRVYDKKGSKAAAKNR